MRERSGWRQPPAERSPCNIIPGTSYVQIGKALLSATTLCVPRKENSKIQHSYTGSAPRAANAASYARARKTATKYEWGRKKKDARDLVQRQELLVQS